MVLLRFTPQIPVPNSPHTAGLSQEILSRFQIPSSLTPEDGLTRMASSAPTYALTLMDLADGMSYLILDSDCDSNDTSVRVCPGQHIASRSIFIDLALLLWSFQIRERPDAPIDVDAFDESVTLEWHPFEVEFVPRVDETKLREVMEEGIHSI